ncbi:PEP-CTERM system histidine kinase PrsK [Hahella sp. KA22]|uniref:XrtA/PEP-CTERM system histidine kinase PrsK n=2 Tax=Hahella sp. KA22 TaxID=1628392 RepID=UPI000FDF1A34|nr:XrtA/PEP-CTERM system histidine kinase PrsK [Hahella sp. KA22]AZZ92976.1 PEP-CTERM system histidine kinase PrsK [Hahella sp. KA22]QAY56350.1 PEP-CTERM system histidine kinase PrsK [Hahella sp. KA22]
MVINFGAISHATGALVYFLITLLLARGYMRRLVDRALLTACLVTSIWLGALAAQQAIGAPSFVTRYCLEVVRNAAWIGVLFIILGINLSPRKSNTPTQYWLGMSIIAVLAVMLVAGFTRSFTDEPLISGQWLLLGQISVSLAGLVMLEQVWRNATGYKRSNIRYLCLGIGAFYIYDFFLYSDALLFNKISAPFWDARGAVNTICAPLVALTMVNTRKQPIDVQISRQFVFHTSALVFAGLYLLIMSAGGYYINTAGGSWSEALLIIFFFSSTIILVLLGSSAWLRARLMVFISQHFFNYKYDYREEWLSITRLLTTLDSDEALEKRIIRVMSNLVESHAGALWLRDEDNSFSAKAFWNMSEIKFDKIDVSSELVEFLSQGDWVVNLKEYQIDPTRYHLMEIPDCIWNTKKPWLIVPLFVRESLFGFVLIAEPIAKIELNWENYDLLKIVARQAGGYLALLQTQDRLSESKQFEAVNRTSAFMVHDLKTIIAQLSLLVNNAERHKTNPVFIDDMIRTTEHALKKMNHLLVQIRNPVTRDEITQFDLVSLIKDVIAYESKREPHPSFSGESSAISITADKDKLKSVFVHLIQNAQDATDKTGEVSVSVKRSAGWVVVFVQDTGCGMTDEFIKGQLFKPFESTKGLTGMGIGVYQSREYIRKLGGSVDVTSQVGVGTCFTIKIPIVGAAVPPPGFSNMKAVNQ